MLATPAGVELESMEYHRESETQRARYDQDTTSASMAVVASLSEVMDVDPIELEPLSYTIDTGALDTLVRVQDPTEGDISITFAVEEYAITVYSYGMIAIAPTGYDRTDDLNDGIPHK